MRTMSSLERGLRNRSPRSSPPRPPSLTLLLLLILLLALLHPHFSSADTDPYSTLGVPRSATLADIKKAYRRLSKQHHPDKSSDPSSPDRFTAISAAYELLSDADKRSEYDRYGRVQSSQERYAPPQRNPGAFHFSSFFAQHQRMQERLYAYATHADELSVSSPHIHKLTSDNYDALVTEHRLAQQQTVELWLVEVYADSCTACQALHGHVTAVDAHLRALHLQRFVKVGSVHADFEPQLTRQLNVRSVPYAYIVTSSRHGQRTIPVPYSAFTKDELLNQLAAQYQLHATIAYPQTLDRTKPARAALQQRVRLPHVTQSHLYLVSHSARPSLLLSFIASYFSSSTSVLFVHVASVVTGSRAEKDLAALMHLGQDGAERLMEGDSIWVYQGDTQADVKHIASFSGPRSVDEMVALIAPHVHVHVPGLMPATFYPLCVRPKHPPSSLLRWEEEGVSALPATACLIYVTGSQQSADTAFPLRAWQGIVRASRVQLSWVHQDQQQRWLAWFGRSRRNVRAILLRGATGEYQTWDGGGSLMDWAEVALAAVPAAWTRAWESDDGGYPIFEQPQRWSDRMQDALSEVAAQAAEYLPSSLLRRINATTIMMVALAVILLVVFAATMAVL